MNKQNFYVISVICFIIMILFAKFCWNRVLGFNVCENVSEVSAYNVIIDENNETVNITGKTQKENSGFSGHIYEVRGRKLYVGIRKNIFSGIFNKRNYFDIKLPCKASSLDEIVFFDGKRERRIWRRHGFLNRNIKSRIINKE